MVGTVESFSYCDGIREGFRYLLANYPEVFVIGQGLWSPWYVGDSMRDLDKEFGTERLMDTPVSEMACTGAAVGASLFGHRAIVVHPRMDFMLLAVDQVVNQAAKWSYMVGGQARPAVTIRAIINRGGEQGAQHSQALHAWFAHIPGLRVVMPATPRDARELLVASVLCDDPVLYLDDRWLYGWEQEGPPIAELDLTREGPVVLRQGEDVTLAGAGFSAYQAFQAAETLGQGGVSAEVVDLRVLNPLDIGPVAESVARTGRLLVIDGGWRTCGLAGEVIAATMEAVDRAALLARPMRLTLPDAPAPSSRRLEEVYYLSTEQIVAAAVSLVAGGQARRAEA